MSDDVRRTDRDEPVRRSPEREAATIAGQRHRSRIRDVEQAIRRVRWVAIGFSIVMPLLFEPAAEGVRPSVDLLAAGVAMTMVLVVAQGLSLWTERLPVERAAVWGWGILAIDTVVATSVPIVYAFDHYSDFWPLLTFVIIEGAMRGGARGSMAVWAVGGGAFAVNSFRLLETRPNPDSWLAAIPWAVGILLMVAVGAGSLGSRVRDSDANVDAWRQRLDELTRRVQDLQRHQDIDAVLDEVAVLASWLTGGARAQVVGRDRPAPERGSDTDERTSVVLSVDGGQQLQVRHTSGPLTEDDLALLDLLCRHASSALTAIDSASDERHRAEQMRALADQKNRFLATLAHELRTPMTIIQGNATLLMGDQELPGDSREFLTTSLASNLDRFGQLLTDATDAMRLDAELLPVTLQSVDMAEVVPPVVQAHVAPSANHRPVVCLPDELPPVAADPARLRQVLHNLVANAVNFSPDGGEITVTARADDQLVHLAVADQGVGIPETEMYRLFGRMERLHPHLAIGGTGLGLNLSRDLVRAMHGDITVDSTVGRGSTFTVTLPRAPAA